MSLVISVFAIIIFIIIYKLLDDQFSLLLYGVFLIQVTLNFNTYFVTGLIESGMGGWTPFVVVCGLLTTLTFIKFIYFVNKTKNNLKENYES